MKVTTYILAAQSTTYIVALVLYVVKRFSVRSMHVVILLTKPTPYN
jgi:hypothetical protein